MLAPYSVGSGLDLLELEMDASSSSTAQFIEAVSGGRKLPVDQVRKLADGRVFSGRQAQKLGLVDELGGLEKAIDVAAKLGKVQGEPQVIWPEREQYGWLRELLSGKARAPCMRVEYRWAP